MENHPINQVYLRARYLVVVRAFNNTRTRHVSRAPCLTRQQPETTEY